MTKRVSGQLGCFTKGLSKSDFIGRTKKGKRLAAKAEVARERRVHWLRRQHSSSVAAQALADKLASCAPRKRCLSGACPVCAQAAQERFVRLVCNFSRECKA